jgi:hypothetical protein
MARKKVARKQQASATTATMVTRHAVHLHSLMERAKTGESAAVGGRSYLDAGGSLNMLVKVTAAGGVLTATLTQSLQSVLRC